MDIKLLTSKATVPTKGSIDSAGWDLYSADDYEILPGQTVKVSTGIAIALPVDTFGGIFARSGLATKRGLRPANCVGVVDSDYRGEVIVALHNDSNESQYIELGERIAQLIVLPYVPVELNVINELDETERGASGFGSTGTK